VNKKNSQQDKKVVNKRLEHGMQPPLGAFIPCLELHKECNFTMVEKLNSQYSNGSVFSLDRR